MRGMINSLFTKDIGIDLGTASILVYIKGIDPPDSTHSTVLESS